MVFWGGTLAVVAMDYNVAVSEGQVALAAGKDQGRLGGGSLRWRNRCRAQIALGGGIVDDCYDGEKGWQQVLGVAKPSLLTLLKYKQLRVHVDATFKPAPKDGINV
eukprot:scaffold31448_cov87-Cyclotella_meneghiniana.AAC.2